MFVFETENVVFLVSVSRVPMLADKHVCSYCVSLQIINAFVASERQYLNTLGVLHRCYELPLKMLCTFKPEVISIRQLDSIFLNW